MGISVLGMNGATLNGNTEQYTLVDANPSSTWGKCPLVDVGIGSRRARHAPARRAGRRHSTTTPTAASSRRRRRTVSSDRRRAEWRPALEGDVRIPVRAVRDGPRRHDRGGVGNRLERDRQFVPGSEAHGREHPATVAPVLGSDRSAVAGSSLTERRSRARSASWQISPTLAEQTGSLSRHHRSRASSSMPTSERGTTISTRQARWNAQAVCWDTVAATLKDSDAVAWYDLMNEPTMATGSTWCAGSIRRALLRAADHEESRDAAPGRRRAPMDEQDARRDPWCGRRRI